MREITTTGTSSTQRSVCARVRPAARGVAHRPAAHRHDGAFDDRANASLAAFDEACSQAVAAMAVAYRAGDSWLDAVRGALFELLAFLDEHPALARLLVVDSLIGDAAMRARRDSLLAELACALEAERPAVAQGSLPAPFGGQAVVGAVAAILHGRLLEEPVPSLRDLCTSLMGLIVLPYLDAPAARGELLRRCPTGGGAHP